MDILYCLKIIFIPLAYIVFSFIGFASNDVVYERVPINNLIQMKEMFYIDAVDIFSKTDGCLLKITIILKDYVTVV